MKKKVIVIAAIVVLAIIGLIGYVSVSDLRQGVLIRKEVDTIGKLDITKDDIDMTIKTKGNYAIVEKAIKEYMNTYSLNCKELMKILEDEKIAQILTAQNYKNDGPDFTNTKKYISDTKLNFNEKINILIDMTNEEKMMEKINNENLEENFVELYKELMLGEQIKVDLQETVQELQKTNTLINNMLDVQEKVINLLTSNKGKWSVNSDDEIEFQTQKLVDEYNNLISSL